MLPKQCTYPKLFTCTPDDNIHCVLTTLRTARIRRIPVIDREGGLVGVLSMDDIVLRACVHAGKHDISCKDVVEAYKALCAPQEVGTMRRSTVAG